MNTTTIDYQADAQALEQRLDNSNSYCILPASLCIEVSEEFEDLEGLILDNQRPNWQYLFEYAYFWGSTIRGGHDIERQCFGTFSERNPDSLPRFLCIQLPASTREEALEICDRGFAQVWDELEHTLSDPMYSDTNREDFRDRVRTAIHKVYDAAQATMVEVRNN